MEILFHRMCLVASSEQAELAHVTDLSTIKPYVKAIVMKPTKYSWTMTADIFEDIVLIGPLQEFCDRDREKIWARRDAGEDISGATYLGRDQFANLGMRGFVENYMDGKMPFSDQEIKIGFERYMQHAQFTQNAYETKQIQHAWTKVLAQFPNVHTFKFRRWNHGHRNKTPWKDLGCDIEEHEHYYGKGHEEAVCRQLQEPVGEALFSAAIASLTAARSRIEHLTIKSVVDGHFTWADNGELDDLDLLDLETLSFQPVMAEYYTVDSESVVTNRCGIATTALLHKCRDTLQKLDFCSSLSHCPMSWPPSSVPGTLDLPSLPVLTSFRTCLTLNLSAFARFLHCLPALSHLQLDSCHGDNGTWRDLWDAIRNHTNRMELEFDQLPCVDWTELGLCHHTGEASKEEFVEDPYERIQYSLENYLSGRIHWDRSLRLWFDDDDEPSEDEDEDEDEEDDEDDDEDGEDDEYGDDGDNSEDQSKGGDELQVTGN